MAYACNHWEAKPCSFLCHLTSDSWCNHPPELWSAKIWVKYILVAIEEWIKYAKKKIKKKGGREKRKRGKKIAKSLCLEAKTYLGWGHADASWPVESHISSHHTVTGQLGGVLVSSFFFQKIYIKRFLLSLPCRPIILLAPTPIIRHVDGMWLTDSILHNQPPDMPNCMERTERVLLEYSLAVQASNKNTKWLMPRHWQRTIKALTICIEDRSFVRHISSGGSSPPIRTPLLCLIQHFPTVLVPNCCNDQGQEWNYLFLFFHAWHHFVLLCLVSTWTPVVFLLQF